MENEIENEASKEGKVKKLSKKKKLIIISTAVVAIIAIAVVTIFSFAGKKKSNDGMYVINQNNYQQIKANMDAQVAEGYFETYMNTEWTFADGKSASKDAAFGNSPNNTKPIRCVVTLDATGETLFKSDVLPVGAQLRSIKLDKDLSAGLYPATCTIYLMKQEDNGKYTDFSNAGFSINIRVEK